MVIIRESPRTRPSPGTSHVPWPPASPFHALLSSPSGRKKWQDLQEHNRPRSISPSSRGGRRTELKTNMGLSDDEANDMDDEESLKLKLEILETKQKLKELTRKKREQHERGDQSASWSPSKRRKLLATGRDNFIRGVQVPVSPSKAQATTLPASPARVRLGIPNTRAVEVSLKRPSAASKPPATEPRPISSFSQRLANSRSTTKEKSNKSERLDSVRSKSFHSMQPREAPAPASSVPLASLKRLIDPRPVPLEPRETTTTAAKSKKRADSRDPAFYDPFSEIHLSSRKISHTDVAKSLTGCEIYTLPRLLKEVKSPDYDPPDCETDYVVFGVLAEKTSPFQQRETTRVHDRSQKEDDTRMAKNKFMVLRLCDLKWEMDCYLFGTGFEQYWKLTEGTLIAILNPAIMPPKTNQHSGRFSLKVTSSEDRILEIGLARDLGYCISVKKDGKNCSSWVNKRKSEYCEFHVNLMVERARKGRMEVNTMWQGVNPEEKPKTRRNPNVSYNAEHGQLWSVGGVYGKSAANLLDNDDTDALHNLTKDEASRKRIAAQQRERDLAKQLGPTGGGVAGDYLRARHGISSSTDETTEGEVMFAKPTAAELGLLSRKAVDQRLSPAKDRRRHFGIGAVSSAGTEAMGWGVSRKYGLLQPKENRTSSPERGQTRLDTRSVLQSPTRSRSSSPRKKARFMLEKGIREPGRESGGHEVLQSHEDNDDDDDLDIV